MRSHAVQVATADVAQVAPYHVVCFIAYAHGLPLPQVEVIDVALVHHAEVLQTVLHAFQRLTASVEVGSLQVHATHSHITFLFLLVSVPRRG